MSVPPNNRTVQARRDYILSQVARTGEVDVAIVAEELGVSHMTVRRDLSFLDGEGLVRRVHGGATLRPSPDSRSRTMSAEKSDIARAVDMLVRPGDVVAIDVGSTCTAAAAMLAERDDLTVLTTSLRAALKFTESKSTVIVLGGRMNSEGSLVAGSIFDHGQPIHVDIFILGCGGISARQGISYHDLDETALRRRLLGWSKRVVLVADHSKFERVRPFILGGVEIIDTLVTSRQPSAELKAALERNKVEVVSTDALKPESFKPTPTGVGSDNT